MKLMNREPTEEMLDAANCAEDEKPLSDWGKIIPLTFGEVWEAMYDAAPEIHINMEPVAWVESESMTHTKMCLMDAEIDEEAKVGMTPLYSAEQVAALQAENERIASERDDLVAIVRELWCHQDPSDWQESFADEIRQVLAKYEGEKHDAT